MNEILINKDKINTNINFTNLTIMDERQKVNLQIMELYDLSRPPPVLKSQVPTLPSLTNSASSTPSMHSPTKSPIAPEFD